MRLKLYSITSVVFVLLAVLLFYAYNFSDKEPKNLSHNHDEEAVPEWLKLNVEEVLFSDGLNVWIPTGSFETSSLIRVPKYPRKIKEVALKNNPEEEKFIITPIPDSLVLRISGVRNEQISAQLALASDKDISHLEVEISDFVTRRGKTIKKENTLIRFVKYVPIERARSEYVWSPKVEEIIGSAVSGSLNPNVVADVLLEQPHISVAAYNAQPIWFTFKVPKEARPGTYRGMIKIKTAQNETKNYPVELEVQKEILPDYEDYKFHLDLWVNPSAIAEIYKIDHWSEEHWELIEKYLTDYAKAGGKNITTTITREPWHKPWINGKTHSQTKYGYHSMVKWIKGEDNLWKFDYSIFDRYVSTAKKLGINGDINAFSLTPFLTKQKIYYFDEQRKRPETTIIDILDDKYQLVWEAFLKDFKSHLLQKGWYKETYLGFDEKPNETLEVVKNVIKKAAPAFLNRITIAGHVDATNLAENLSISYMFFPDLPLAEKASLPIVSTIQKRKKEQKKTTFYLCAEPAHPNTLTYSPAIEARLIPWLALKYDTDGYLRWAYNNWNEDPFNNPVFLHNQGDDYYVYPGKDKPLSSIRWELLKEGIEDYELFNIIKEKGVISADSLSLCIELATRNQDGRYKKSDDFTLVRNIILSNGK